MQEIKKVYNALGEFVRIATFLDNKIVVDSTVPEVGTKNSKHTILGVWQNIRLGPNFERLGKKEKNTKFVVLYTVKIK